MTSFLLDARDTSPWLSRSRYTLLDMAARLDHGSCVDLLTTCTWARSPSANGHCNGTSLSVLAACRILGLCLDCERHFRETSSAKRACRGASLYGQRNARLFTSTSGPIIIASYQTLNATGCARASQHGKTNANITSDLATAYSE